MTNPETESVQLHPATTSVDLTQIDTPSTTKKVKAKSKSKKTAVIAKSAITAKSTIEKPAKKTAKKTTKKASSAGHKAQGQVSMEVWKIGQAYIKGKEIEEVYADGKIVTRKAQSADLVRVALLVFLGIEKRPKYFPILKA